MPNLIQTFGSQEGKLLLEKARTSPRLRQNHNLHNLEDTVQRFANALLPFSYVRPHRHLSPPKTETFILLKGRVWVVIFDDTGEIIDGKLMDGKRIQVVDILPGCWHTLIATKPSITFEVKPGPYDPATDKEFAAWAPSEEEKDLHVRVIRSWLKKLPSFL